MILRSFISSSKDTLTKVASHTHQLYHILTFMLTIGIYGLLIPTRQLAKRWLIFDRVEKLLLAISAKMDQRDERSISRLELIDLSLQHLRTKRSRTMITVGGMTVGIAAIVFLVSVGYGLQSLVIDRVARLEEMRQTDVSAQPGSNLALTEEVLDSFRRISEVKLALPQIAVVGEVTFNQSSTDMAVYGVTKEYLQQSAISPTVGRVFESTETKDVFAATQESSSDDETSTSSNPTESTDSSARPGDIIGDVQFTVDQGEYVRVRASATADSELLGYTTSEVGPETGTEIWGDRYIDDAGNGTAGETAEGSQLGKWVQARVPLWEEEDGGYQPLYNEQDQQVIASGYIAEIGVSVSSLDNTQTATANDGLSSISDPVSGSSKSATIRQIDETFVEIEGESNTENEIKTSTVSLSDQITDREAVVNRSFLEVLGISESQAIGQTFDVSFIVTGKLLSGRTDRIESIATTYEIVGVTPDEQTPLFYVPFIHLKSLGIENYSQAKIVVENESDLPAVRQQIESAGFTTNSVSDTVAQINDLFRTARVLLALVGLVALSIASLGMFNTLTVSLLERTREVGLLKAMGMKSREVRDLFLAESMVMGSLGGILGIAVGIFVGKIVEILISIYAISQGAGYIALVDIPIAFGLLIIFLSFLVGILTGLYPARRATQISALNALRYE